MGKCLTSMNCNDNENTKYFGSDDNGIEIEGAENKSKSTKAVSSGEVKYPQIALSIGNMLVSPSTYSYMFKTNSNFEDFIESKLKGISPSNQVLIARFMFENIKQKENSTHSKSSQEIVSNTLQSMVKTFSDLLIILPIENTKTGINKLMSNVVFHLTEIHHYLNFQSAMINQRRDEFYHKNFWVNIEDTADYFSMKVAQAGQNLQNVKTYLVNRKNSQDNRSNISK